MSEGANVRDNSMILIAALVSFTFVSVGIQENYTMYLTTYAVKSSLHLTEVDGSHLTAFYSGAYAVTR